MECVFSALVGGFIATQTPKIELRYAPSKWGTLYYQSSIDVEINKRYRVVGTTCYTLEASDILGNTFSVWRRVLVAKFDQELVYGEELWTLDKEVAGGVFNDNFTAIYLYNDFHDRLNANLDSSFSLQKDGRRNVITVPGYDSPLDIGLAYNLVWPNGALSKGETWFSKQYVSGLGEFFVQYQLESFTDSEAQIVGQALPNGYITNSVPYRYVIDRKTGRPTSISGSVFMNYMGHDIVYSVKVQQVPRLP